MSPHSMRRRKTAIGQIVVLLGILFLASANGSMVETNRRKLPVSEPFDACVANLIQVADDNTTVSTTEFLEFLLVASESKLQFTTFKSLPLQLIDAFIFGACYQDDCITGGTTIKILDSPGDLSDDSAGYIRLKVFCDTTAKYIEETPPTPFSSVSVRFSYIIRHSSGLTDTELLAGTNDNSIVADLEDAANTVILNALGCGDSNNSRRLGMHSSMPKQYSVEPHLASEEDPEEDFKQHVDEITRGKSHVVQLTEESRNLQECRFTVNAPIANIYDNDAVCKPAATGDEQCSIVLSTAIISTKSYTDIITAEEEEELKKTALVAMQSSIAEEALQKVMREDSGIFP